MSNSEADGSQYCLSGMGGKGVSAESERATLGAVLPLSADLQRAGSGPQLAPLPGKGELSFLRWVLLITSNHHRQGETGVSEPPRAIQNDRVHTDFAGVLSHYHSVPLYLSPPGDHHAVLTADLLSILTLPAAPLALSCWTFS